MLDLGTRLLKNGLQLLKKVLENSFQLIVILPSTGFHLRINRVALVEGSIRATSAGYCCKAVLQFVKFIG
jgi:hypothetical protein